MRRLACHLLAPCAAASSALRITVCVLWLRSDHRPDGVRWSPADWLRPYLLGLPISARGIVASSFVDRHEANVAFPGWAPALAFACLMLSFLVRLVRGRLRRESGLCRRCGYDLRASPDRCPSCGTAARG